MLRCLSNMPSEADHQQRNAAHRQFKLNRQAALVCRNSRFAFEMLEHDLYVLQDRGLNQLDEDRDRLRQRYASVDHPVAAEVVRWLDGAHVVWLDDVPPDSGRRRTTGVRQMPVSERSRA